MWLIIILMAKSKKKSKKKSYLPALLVLFASVLIATGYWYFSLTAPKLPNAPLKDLAKAHGVELGIHVDYNRLSDRIYPDIIRSQFSFVNIDGGAHFSEIHPSPDKTDFSKSDKIVEFAEQNGMEVELHHLVWGDKIVLPKWLTEGNYAKQQLLDILHSHITSMVKHYKGRVKRYTVTNETFTEKQRIFGLRNWWAEQLGEDEKYIDSFFTWARETDPGAELVLNDFYNETKNSASDAMYEYVKGAKSRGVPIDGIGMQMHIDASRAPKKQEVIDSMNRFADLGVKVYVTEFDVNTSFVKLDRAEKDKLEASITHDMARACIESKNCVSFNVFGLTSKNDLYKKITRANSRDYMFDSRFRPRPSFYSFRQAWQNP